jgi:site-specific recombinase XerD
MTKQLKLKRRGKAGMFYLVRHVPVDYRAVEPRKEVWVPLKTDSETLAQQKAARIWDKTVAGWEAKKAGDTSDAERAFTAAQDLAKARGFRWLTADGVAKLPRDELLDRVETVAKANGAPNSKEAAAVLGGAKEPAITVNRALALYWELAADTTRGMSEDQVRRWRNPRIKAIGNFVKIAGNKVLAEITRDDMLKFHAWWSKRLIGEGLSPNSANKDIGYFESTLRTVVEKRQLGFMLPFGKLTFKEDDEKTRPPFSEKWIKGKLLSPGALDGLNPEARGVIYAMVNTGARPSEIVGLLPHHIHLDAKVPHIEVKAEGKKTKNKQSRRVIPLVGISLKAFREFPEGFPSYRFKDRISDTVNKFLRENGLLESEEHTLYGLRHSFEDRLLRAGVDERIRRDLMGHSLGGRQRYGQGATLEHARKLLKAVAY